jgi:hypothetical protein
MPAALTRATLRELGHVAPLARDLDVLDATPHGATPR